MAICIDMAVEEQISADLATGVPGLIRAEHDGAVQRLSDAALISDAAGPDRQRAAADRVLRTRPVFRVASRPRGRAAKSKRRYRAGAAGVI